MVTKLKPGGIKQRGRLMPILGEIRRAKDLGFNNNHKYMWTACVDCGKERWTFMLRGEVRTMRCSGCSNKEGKKFEALQKARRAMRGEKSHRWKGGRYISGNGEKAYIKVTLQPDDPFFTMAGKDYSCREHRLVMARHLERCLEPWEVVHHKNGNRLDNRIENLELMDTVTHHHIDSTVKAQMARMKKRITNLEARVILLEAENELLRHSDGSKIQEIS